MSYDQVKQPLGWPTGLAPAEAWPTEQPGTADGTADMAAMSGALDAPAAPYASPLNQTPAAESSLTAETPSIDEIATAVSGILHESIVTAAAENATAKATEEVRGLYGKLVEGGRQHLDTAKDAAANLTTQVDDAVSGAKAEIAQATQAFAGVLDTATREVDAQLGAATRTAEAAATAADKATTAAQAVVAAQDGAVRTGVVKVLREMAGSRNPEALDLIKEAGHGLLPRHRQTPLLKALVRAGVPAYLHGEAGSGKSTGARLVAGDFKVPYDFLALGPTSGKADMLGYNDAGGRYNSTSLRRIIDPEGEGGVFLFDEIDAGNPGMLVLMNATLANGHTAFPDGTVAHHPRARFVAAANTIGKGADAQYVGRNRIDAATLDRFGFIRWDIDPDLEEAIVLGQASSPAVPINMQEGGVPTPKEWLETVRAYRNAAASSELRLGQLVTPRASEYGARLIQTEHEDGSSGVGMKHLVSMLIHKGASSDVIRKWDAKAKGRP